MIQSANENVNPNICPLKFKPVSQTCGVFNEGTLEYEIDTTDHDVIGNK